jgi:hypothetical protein
MGPLGALRVEGEVELATLACEVLAQLRDGGFEAAILRGVGSAAEQSLVGTGPMRWKINPGEPMVVAYERQGADGPCPQREIDDHMPGGVWCGCHDVLLVRLAGSVFKKKTRERTGL